VRARRVDPWRAAAVGLAVACGGCAALRPVVADTGDLADYRAFRAAAHPGVRLGRAQHYLEAHPRGAWAAEVRAAFDAEEPAYFESMSATREGTREYLADLSHGPHADAAIARLIVFDTRIEDEEAARMLREARRTETMLGRASEQRRGVGEAVLADLAALLEPSVYGASIDDAPPLLARALGGPARPSWGRLPARREEDLFFSLPARPERVSRLLTVVVAVHSARGVIDEGRIEGADLFVHWGEADQMQPLDPTRDADRRRAAAHVRELVGGAIEARLPADRCTIPASNLGDLIARACDGWSARVTQSPAPGGIDAIVIRGPSRSPGPEPPSHPKPSGQPSGQKPAR
jgi:hypothetical protein